MSEVIVRSGFIFLPRNKPWEQDYWLKIEEVVKWTVRNDFGVDRDHSDDPVAFASLRCGNGCQLKAPQWEAVKAHLGFDHSPPVFDVPARIAWDEAWNRDHPKQISKLDV